METKVQLNNLRLAPRKVRAVANLIKKKNVLDAIDQLNHLVKRSSPILLKLLNTAITNAENNFRMVKENLYVKDIMVNEGIKLKRFMPRARGMAYEVQKKTSLVRLVLDEKVPGLKRKEIVQKADEHKKEDKKLEAESKNQKEVKPEIKRELGKKTGVLGNLKKKIFQRKSI